MHEVKQRVFHDLHQLSLSVKARLLRVNEQIRQARRFKTDELVCELKEQRQSTDRLYSEIMRTLNSEVYDQDTLSGFLDRYRNDENVFSDIS